VLNSLHVLSALYSKVGEETKRIIKFSLPVFHSNARRSHSALQTADRHPYNDSCGVVAFTIRKGRMSELILVSSDQ
jgi:hypothetical protein